MFYHSFLYNRNLWAFALNFTLNSSNILANNFVLDFHHGKSFFLVRPEKYLQKSVFLANKHTFSPFLCLSRLGDWMEDEWNENLKAFSHKRKLFYVKKKITIKKRRKETERDKDDGKKETEGENTHTNRIFKSFKIVSMFMLNEDLQPQEKEKQKSTQRIADCELRIPHVPCARTMLYANRHKISTFAFDSCIVVCWTLVYGTDQIHLSMDRSERLTGWAS